MHVVRCRFGPFSSPAKQAVHERDVDAKSVKLSPAAWGECIAPCWKISCDRSLQASSESSESWWLSASSHALSAGAVLGLVFALTQERSLLRAIPYPSPSLSSPFGSPVFGPDRSIQKGSDQNLAMESPFHECHCRRRSVPTTRQTPRQVPLCSSEESTQGCSSRMWSRRPKSLVSLTLCAIWHRVAMAGDHCKEEQGGEEEGARGGIRASRVAAFGAIRSDAKSGCGGQRPKGREVHQGEGAEFLYPKSLCFLCLLCLLCLLALWHLLRCAQPRREGRLKGTWRGSRSRGSLPRFLFAG